MSPTPREQLARDLDRRSPALDVDRLTTGARREGTTLRRRRRLLAVAGTVAALTVGTVGVVATLPDAAPQSRDQVAAGPTTTPSPPPPPATTTEAPPGPATARGAVAALDWALRQAVPGTTSDYFGQPSNPPQDGSSGDYYAQLVFDDGAGAGEVGLNVQFDGGFVSSCEESTWAVRCRSRALPGGGRLTTYDEESPAAGGTHVRRVADLLRPDGVRVVVSASNGFDLSANRYDVRRPEPAFTVAQLAAVVRRGFWGHTLPGRYLEAGEQLRPFREDTGLAEATPAD